jgi:glycosyltransferase involved in cell wall biosynthesis
MVESSQTDGELMQRDTPGKASAHKIRRILFIAPEPIYEDRGTPIAVNETLGALSKLGYIVDLATFPLGSEVAHPKIRVLRTWNPFKYKHVPIGFSLRKVVLDLCLLLTSLRMTMRNHYDCVHGVEEGAGIALVIKALFGVPVIYDMQSSLPEQLKKIRGFDKGPGRQLALLLERLLIKHADAIMTSCGLPSHVLSIDPEKQVVECMFSGQEAGSFNRELAECLGIFQRPTVVYVGNFAAYQGIEELIETAATVTKEIPEVVFLLVGGSAIEIGYLSKLIRKQGIANNVHLYGQQARCELPAYLALADALVLPRMRGKNAPLKLFDYMKSGKPIVATDIPAHRALLSERTAILVRPDPQALAAGIVRAMRDRTLAHEVAQRALAVARLNDKASLLEAIAELHDVVGGRNRDNSPKCRAHLVTIR